MGAGRGGNNAENKGGKPVPRILVGENTPSVRPGDDPALYGSATLTPLAPVPVRSHATFTLAYTVGRLGLDDSGGIRVSFRMVSDTGKLQADDPGGDNYVSARIERGGDRAGAAEMGQICLRIGPEGARPWKLTVTAILNGGYLDEGDKIILVFGDTSGGGAGMLMQSFAEAGFEFRVATDIQATGNYIPLPEQFAIPVVAGKAAKWVAVLPTLRRAGEAFHFGLKAEDMHGNPTDSAKGRIRLVPSLAVKNLDREFDYAPADRAMLFENLAVMEQGVLRIKVFLDDAEVCEAGPLVITGADASRAHFWGDLHGQTGETVGTGDAEGYFDFARNKAFLDVTAHQANDFQITPRFWKHLNTLTAALNTPGRFTILPGYEWSGNTAIGGDHNVYFATDDREIVRCSHALIEDSGEGGAKSDAHTLTDLFNAMRGTDTVIYAHVGGRYANTGYDHDPVLEVAVEIHSAWGTFEWIAADCFARSRRVGIVCNSDGHKGRPGASYPGASVFGAYGGLTCFIAPENTRAAIMEAQRRRHHYGTTGCRLYMDIAAALPPGSEVFLRDPKAVGDDRGDNGAHAAASAMMGDIVAVAGEAVHITARIHAHSGIESIELRAGTDVLEVIRPYDESALGNHLRVLWEGAESRGRGRATRWQGRMRLSHAQITAIETFNHWNPEHKITQEDDRTIAFDTITTGNFMGFDMRLDCNEGSMAITTNHGDACYELAEVGMEPLRMQAGGLGRAVRVSRLPDAPLPREIDFSRSVAIAAAGDTPIWLCITTGDGHKAWSSPIYAFRKGKAAMGTV